MLLTLRASRAFDYASKSRGIEEAGERNAALE
jgi:hypothetical protein